MLNNNFRSYTKEVLDGKEISKSNLINAYYHKAAFEDHGRSQLVSCVTFQSPYRVPPGVEYAVSRTSINKTNIAFKSCLLNYFQPGLELPLSKEANFPLIGAVYVFVYNKNQA